MSASKPDFEAEAEKARLQNRLATRQDRWGEPDINRAKLIPLGLGPIDAAVWGLDSINGDLILWIGEEKARKSTTVRNVLINMMTAPVPVVKPVTVIDVLETGEPPDKIADDLLCKLASRYLYSAGHRTPGSCPICHGICMELGLSSYFVMYNKLSAEQEAAIEQAAIAMEGWPIMIFGAGNGEGQTRNLKRARQRWDFLIANNQLDQLIVDHLQQYTDLTRLQSDYEKQIQFIATIADLVASEKKIVHVVSQISLTSIRDMRSGTADKLDAAGGRKGAQEANLEFTIRKIDDWKVEVKITRTRRSGSLTVVMPIEKESGTQLDDPVLKH